jgi:hypothetical protein
VRANLCSILNLHLAEQIENTLNVGFVFDTSFRVVDKLLEHCLNRLSYVNFNSKSELNLHCYCIYLSVESFSTNYEIAYKISLVSSLLISSETSKLRNQEHDNRTYSFAFTDYFYLSVESFAGIFIFIFDGEIVATSFPFCNPFLFSYCLAGE